jgi:RNA polymerase sigma-70 factor (ECF subfamily)
MAFAATLDRKALGGAMERPSVARSTNRRDIRTAGAEQQPRLANSAQSSCVAPLDMSSEQRFVEDADEAALLTGLRAGNEAAFEKLVRTYSGRLLAVARRFLPSEEDARDALQDAFLSAFRAINGFEEGARISTWLHRIVINAALMKLRTRRRKPEESIDDLLPQFADDGHRVDPGPAWKEPTEDAWQRQETRHLVRTCIDCLPETYRTVLLLRDIEELDTEAVAQVLDITQNAVKIRLHRARQALRTLLDPHLREAPV